jgi:hypothetical protein
MYIVYGYPFFIIGSMDFLLYLYECYKIPGL